MSWFLLGPKPIPSAYIQDSTYRILHSYFSWIDFIQLYSRRLHIPSATNNNRPVLQPTPILPIYSNRRSVTLIAAQPKHLSLFKDRMVKATLAQRASFKCKSPLPYRPESSLSRSTTAVLTASQLQIRTHNPLKVHPLLAVTVNSLIAFLVYLANRCEFNAQWSNTKSIETIISTIGYWSRWVNKHKDYRLFHSLSLSLSPRHLTYPQVQKCLPANLPRAQETFFRVVGESLDRSF